MPDEPQFTVGPRVGVAAWVHPNTTSGHRPIVIKRLENKKAIFFKDTTGAEVSKDY